MDSLIIRSFQGRTTAQEEEKLLRWREAAPENEERYEELRGLWFVTGHAQMSSSRSRVPDPDAIIDRAEAGDPSAKVTPIRSVSSASGGAPGAGSAGQRGTRRKWAVPGSIAAAFALLGFGLGVFFEGLEEPAVFSSSVEVVTGRGELTTVTLADGTAVRVAPSSTLLVVQEGADYVAQLDGRAFFGVEPDPTRTFTVRTPHGEASALGTRFEVDSTEEFRVMVVEGRVRVTSGDEDVELGDGYESRSSAGGPLTTTLVPNIDERLGWMGDALVFRATPLARAMSEIENRYGIEVTLDDPALGEEAVTATFTDQSPGEVVAVLCETVGARCLDTATGEEFTRMGGAAGL